MRMVWVALFDDLILAVVHKVVALDVAGHALLGAKDHRSVLDIALRGVPAGFW